VRDQCRAGAPPMLAEVRAEFRETLFAHAAAGGYDTSDEDALRGGWPNSDRSISGISA
jgi:hypothetical protein